MSIKDDDGFMDVFSRYTMGTVDMSVDYYTRKLLKEDVDYYTRKLLKEDFEIKQTSLMDELIEYIDENYDRKKK